MAARFLYRFRHGEDPPPGHFLIEHNQRISARYGRWYLDRPELFKWAGAAAFASHRVGVLLAAYDLDVEVDDSISDVFDRLCAVGGRITRAICGAGGDPQETERGGALELLRLANDLVFEDIGWAHEAYLKGGIAAVEAGRLGLPAPALLLQGFRQIDRGKQLLAGGANEKADGTDQIWRGNLRLLEHEQRNVIQPQLAKMAPGTARRLLSRFVWMDFSMKSVTEVGDVLDGTTWSAIVNALGRQATPTKSFYTFLQESPRRLARTGGEPDFADFEQRWFWVEKHVFPLWREVEGSDIGLRQRLEELIARPHVVATAIATEGRPTGDPGAGPR